MPGAQSHNNERNDKYFQGAAVIFYNIRYGRNNEDDMTNDHNDESNADRVKPPEISVSDIGPKKRSDITPEATGSEDRADEEV
ncbi:hypothetical protein C0991_003686 [Blastosporella zonata]|nr:hypothetical protein C0991_003686 [Blastosporella zonata]